MTKIAIVPAKSGSVRIPDKNIRLFRGTPMLKRTIECLKKSKSISRVIISTDSIEYASQAIEWGAEVPFLRSPNLSSDSANTIDVISDAIDKLQLTPNDNICCVYATNPLLDPRIVDLGSEILSSTDTECYVTPVVRYGFPPQRSISVKHNGLAAMLYKENMYLHSQNLEVLYHETAQFWWARQHTWASKVGMQEIMKPIIVQEWMQQDIDTMDDWYLAEAKFDFLNINLDLLENEVQKIITRYLPVK